MDKVKKEKVIDQEIWNTATQIANDFNYFTSGYRCLFLIHRSKEGAPVSNNEKLRKIIVNGYVEYVDALYSLLQDKNISRDKLRIYASVNERDFDKGMRHFKFAQLEADYYDAHSKHDFYIDIKNRFISALCSPQSKKTGYFILDCDSVDEHTTCLKTLAYHELNDLIIKQYPTKNGWHIVTLPFNPALLGDLASKISKDGLILLSY